MIYKECSHSQLWSLKTKYRYQMLVKLLFLWKSLQRWHILLEAMIFNFILRTFIIVLIILSIQFLYLINRKLSASDVRQVGTIQKSLGSVWSKFSHKKQ